MRWPLPYWHSIQKVKRLRKRLGWVMTSTKYCQLIWEANQVKWLEFSDQCLWANEQFDNVIFTDECSVYMMENQGKITFHRNCEQPRVIKADQSIQWKSTFGAEFLNGVRRGWWSSKASWMLNSTWQRTERNRTVLAGKTRSGKMFQIHRTFAECAADCCRPPRKSFWQRVAKSPKWLL